MLQPFQPNYPIVSYMILAPNEMKAESNEQKSCRVCLEKIKLDTELYRLGHTKARTPKSMSSLRRQHFCRQLFLHSNSNSI
jgi:hypothetical protein